MGLEKIKHYFQHNLWDFSLHEKKGCALFYYKTLRIAALAIRGFIQDKCFLRASSLTYYTMMSLVPILAMAFIYFQVGVARYGAIYGSLAALPLFLVWVQMNWFLLLFGSQISFAHQTHEQREYEPAVEQMSNSFRLLLALWIVQICIERFMNRRSPLSLDLLIRKYQIPYSIATLLVHQLVDADILIEVKERADTLGYVPKRDINQLRISDVIEALQNMGLHDFPQLTSKILQRLEESLESFRQKIEQSELNHYLKDF
jgi:membrane protein